MKTVPVTKQDTCYRGANASIEDVHGFSASGMTVLRWRFEPEEVAALKMLIATEASDGQVPVTILQYCVGTPPTQALLVASGDPNHPMSTNTVIGPLNELAASLQVVRAVLLHTIQPDGEFTRDVHNNQDTFYALRAQALASKVMAHHTHDRNQTVVDIDVTPKKEIVVTLSDRTVYVYSIDFTSAYAAGGIDKAL